MSGKVSKIVTDRIIELLDGGIIPWVKPWSVSADSPMVQISAGSGEPYHGFNQMFLSMITRTHGFPCSQWITPKECIRRGLTFKGAKTEMVIYFTFLEKETEKDGETKTDKIPIMRYYRVLNCSMVENWESHFPADRENPVSTPPNFGIADRYLTTNHIPVSHGGDRAFYSPLSDSITLPEFDDFGSEAEYFSTLYHETIHSTGHSSRFDRITHKSWGDSAYSFEELVAEFGASMLYGTAGVYTDRTVVNSTAYIQSWKKSLSDNPNWIVSAVSKAEKAAEMVLSAE